MIKTKFHILLIFENLSEDLISNKQAVSNLLNIHNQKIKSYAIANYIQVNAQKIFSLVLTIFVYLFFQHKKQRGKEDKYICVCFSLIYFKNKFLYLIATLTIQREENLDWICFDSVLFNFYS